MADTLNRTLSRGLNVLELLSEHPDGLLLNQIARQMGLPKSTAFNLVHTLHDLKYIRFQPETAKYSLALKMFEVGSSAVNHLDISVVVRKYMNEIFKQLNETVHCGFFSGGDIIYIDKLESTRSIRMTSHVGVRMPLYCTAMGKAVLGALPDSEIDQLLSGASFTKYARNTVPDMEQLYQQLKRVREVGYAVEREENNDNVCCVGVAVRDRTMRPQYALSISVPSFRFDDEKERLYSQHLLHAQRKIERFLRAL